jgi:hypothetical protein
MTRPNCTNRRFFRVSTATILAIGGGLSGTLGSIVTAFSLNRLLAELKLAHQSLRISVEAAITTQGDVPIFRGIDERISAAETTGSCLTWVGVVLLALGFILQALSVVAS